MIQELIYDQDNPESEAEWLDCRSDHITSSNAAALFNASPYTSELELWHELVSGRRTQISETKRMRAGKRLEPAIGSMVAEDLETRCLPFKRYLYDDEAMLGSSYDWRVWDKHSEWQGWLVEIKNVDSLVYRRTWIDDEGDEVAPAHIEIQCQWQLMLYPTAPGVILAVLVGGNDLRLIKIERDRDMIELLRERAAGFWRSIRERREPEIDFKRDAEFIIRLHQSSEERVLELTDSEQGEHLLELALTYQEHAAVEKDAKANKAAAKAEILHAVGDDIDKILLPGYSVSCKMTKDAQIEAHVRAGYRGFRVTKASAKRGKKAPAKGVSYSTYEANR